MELEKPQPEQAVIDIETETKSETPMAAFDQTSESPSSKQPAGEIIERNNEDLPPGTIQACYQPGPFAFRRVARAPSPACF